MLFSVCIVICLFVLFSVFFFFFFKQKTAYEMRISDWSSDVCSSDLLRTNGVSVSSIQNIVILTGAGVSAESGIDTFRDAGGLWEQHRVEDVATPEAFARDPDLVLRFYDMRREAIQVAEAFQK